MTLLGDIIFRWLVFESPIVLFVRMTFQRLDNRKRNRRIIDGLLAPNTNNQSGVVVCVIAAVDAIKKLRDLNIAAEHLSIGFLQFSAAMQHRAGNGFFDPAHGAVVSFGD